MTECTSCHGRDEEGMDEKCLDCHKDIRWLKRAGRGLHAYEDGNCASCHPEHGGENLSLIDWGDNGPDGFDHRRTGYRLAGKHAAQECRACHQQKLQVSDVTKLSPRRSRARSFVGLEPVCASCHEDVHRGTLGNTCQTCHDSAGWRPAPGFQHAATEYALTGRHAEVTCLKCHAPERSDANKGGGASLVVFSPLRFAECTNCHDDPHRQRLGTNCSSCHDTEGFRQVKERTFDHARTRYPLEGRHASVACAKCHRAPLPRGAAGDAWGRERRLRPPHDLCADCHGDDHGGQLAARQDQGECGSCHKVEGWSPSTYGVDAHARLELALEGRHADIKCDACHLRNSEGISGGVSPEALGRARVALAVLDPSCASCHVEPHEGRFSAGGVREKPEGCLTCHDMSRFSPSRIDVDAHRGLGYPIEGAHRDLRCDQCHAELSHRRPSSSLLRAGLPVSPLPFDKERQECKSCHENPHRDQFAGRRDGDRCESCHGQGHFRPAVGFDHSRTRFPLLRSHSRLACNRCHDSAKDETGRPVTLYRPTSLDCDGCHRLKANSPGVRRPASPAPGTPGTTSPSR